MKKIFDWIVYSSQDADRVSLALKSFLVAATTYVVFFAGLFHFNIPTGDLSLLTDALITMVKYGLETISSVMTVYGLCRKIFHTIKGTNDVLLRYGA